MRVEFFLKKKKGWENFDIFQEIRGISLNVFYFIFRNKNRFPKLVQITLKIKEMRKTRFSLTEHAKTKYCKLRFYVVPVGVFVRTWHFRNMFCSRKS